MQIMHEKVKSNLDNYINIKTVLNSKDKADVWESI